MEEEVEMLAGWIVDVKLRQWDFQISIPNKMDEMLLPCRINKSFAHSAALCFMETWLSESIPDSGLYLLGFHLL